MQEKTSIVWHPFKKIPGLKILQAYVMAVTSSGSVLLVRDHDEERFTLPGGKIEENETPEEGILRELREEAQVEGRRLTLLGCIEVHRFDDGGMLIDYHQQLRYACHVDNIEEFIPRKDGFETVERKEVAVKDLPEYIRWMKKDNGVALLRAYEEYMAAL